jgi:hypothetical protein
LPVLFVSAAVSVAPLPTVLFVTNTVLVVGVAVTPLPAGHIAIAVARFEASVVVLIAVTKVPVNVGAVPEHAAVPLPPGVTALHEKKPVSFAPPTVNVVPLPAVKSVTVTVFVEETAVAKFVALLALIAAARSVASVVVLVLSAYVPARVGAVPVQHVFDPLVPAVSVPQVKGAAAPPASVNVFAAAPNVVSVNTTPLPLTAPVKPIGSEAVLHAVIAALRSVASVVVVALFTKPAVMFGAVPEHEAAPFVPAVTVPGEKMPVLFEASVNVLIPAPGVRSVNVTVAPDATAVNPGLVAHPVIAAARLLASVEVVALYWKVAVVVPVHEFVPLLPALTVPHEKPPRFVPPVVVNVPPSVVSVTVTELVLDVALMASPTAHALTAAAKAVAWAVVVAPNA